MIILIPLFWERYIDRQTHDNDKVACSAVGMCLVNSLGIFFEKPLHVIESPLIAFEILGKVNSYEGIGRDT